MSVFLVSLVLQMQPALAQEKAEFYAGLIDQSCVEPLTKVYMTAVIQKESSYRNVVNEASGDYGVAQINFNTWKDSVPGLTRAELMDEEINILIACGILDDLYRHYGEADPFWAGRYHNRRLSLRRPYAEDLDRLVRDAVDRVTMGPTGPEK